MRAIVIDDDYLNIMLIESFCKRYTPYVEIVATADNVPDGIEMLVIHKPHLLFLDIEIHDQSGFDILNAVNQDELMVIMVTAHSKYAVQAVRARVIDYLLKPVLISDFVASVEKCRMAHEKKKPVIENETQSHTPPIENRHISIHHKDHIEIIPIENVLHMEADRSYTIITTMDNIQHISSKPLSGYEEKLPLDLFLRVHNSHIVNIKGITKLLRSKNGGILLLNNVNVPIGVNRKKEVYDRILM